MALKRNLMGLGMPASLSQILAASSLAFTVSGATRASAPSMQIAEYFTYINASNSGSGAVLPDLTKEGMLLSDKYTVVNLLSATCQIYAVGSQTFIGNGNASIAGSVGVDVQPYKVAEFNVLTASTWFYTSSF